MYNGDYLSLLFTFPQIPPVGVAYLFLLGLMRVGPIVALAPFLGSRLPMTVKMGLAISLTAVFLPHILQVSAPPTIFNIDYVAYMLKELVIGVFLGFLVAIPFYIAQSAGILIDFLRGSSALGVFDPTMQTQSTEIGQLYNYMLLALFYSTDGPFFFFHGVFRSFTILPVDTFLPPTFFTQGHALWGELTGLLTIFLALSLQLAAPALLAILMTELFLGIANRLAPNVQIAFLGMALKSLVGLALLWLSWNLILQVMGKETLKWIEHIVSVIERLASLS